MKKFILGLIVGLLLPAIGGFLYLKMGMMPVAANGATPLPMEETIAKMALRARMAKDPVQQSPVPADEANLTQGAHVYVENCAFCHGFAGEKASFAAKGMFPLPPQLQIPPDENCHQQREDEGQLRLRTEDEPCEVLRDAKP